MARITGEILIARPPGEVFAFVSDERNEPRYNPKMLSVEKLSEGPIGSGTQFRAQMRLGRRTLPMDVVFTTFERPNRLGSHSAFLGAITEGEITFEPVDGATLMRWAWDVNPAGATRLLAPVVTFMGRRQERRVWSALKRCLEQRDRREAVAPRDRREAVAPRDRREALAPQRGECHAGL